MTEGQREKLRRIIDLNWDLKNEESILKQFEMVKEITQLKKELREDMGEDEYDEFMESGRRMFAPKEGY